MFVICGHTFSGSVNTRAGNDARAIAVVVPEDTSEAVIDEIKNGSLLEVLDRDGQVTARYQLTGWRSIAKVYAGIQLTWNTISTDEVDELKKDVQALQEENERLEQDNAQKARDIEDLTQAVLELAEIIGDLMK